MGKIFTCFFGGDICTYAYPTYRIMVVLSSSQHAYILVNCTILAMVRNIPNKCRSPLHIDSYSLILEQNTLFYLKWKTVTFPIIKEITRACILFPSKNKQFHKNQYICGTFFNKTNSNNRYLTNLYYIFVHD